MSFQSIGHKKHQTPDGTVHLSGGYSRAVAMPASALNFSCSSWPSLNLLSLLCLLWPTLRPIEGGAS